MNYEQFIDVMLDYVKSKVPDTDLVEVQEVKKNNGVKVVGIVIRREGCNIAPVVYLEEFYKRYLAGAPVEWLSEQLLHRSRLAPPAPLQAYEKIFEFSQIQDKIVYKLINAKENEALLKQVPHLPILDLAIVFCVLLQVSAEESGTILIKNGNMEEWKCPISMLYEKAKENTQKLCPPVLRLLTDFMGEFGEELAGKCPLYVLTNQSGIQGAAVLLYPDIPQKIYKAVGGNYYLLPSSVHEFLIIAEDYGVAPENLKAIVQEVNETQLCKEEFLSDQIYYFNGDIITEM